LERENIYYYRRQIKQKKGVTTPLYKANMKTCFFLIISLFIASCSTPESDSIRIDLNTFYDDPGRGFLFLYPVSDMEDSLHSKITFPNLSEIQDTAFAQIFFTGKNNSAIENGVLVLVGNYASGSPFFWVDYNNDLDFSEAKKLPFADDFIEITIPNMYDSRLVHNIRFHKTDSTEKSGIKEMIDLYIMKGEHYADFYLDERRNIRVGDFVYREDSLRIGLVDYNVNGSYNDLGTDRLVTGVYGGKINGTEEAAGAVVLDSIMYFQGKSHAFEIINVSRNGASVLIRPTPANKIKDRITKGESIPDFTFKLFSGEETSVHQHLKGDKHLYLVFWANWCSGCHVEVEHLKKLHSSYSEKFTIVSLNYNESVEKIISFIDKYEIQWLNGYSTQEINEKLFIDDLPRNILIDPSGNIIEMDIHPSDLLNRTDEF
jgi:thiol-disulfide isomerase/thioredoxin